MRRTITMGAAVLAVLCWVQAAKAQPPKKGKGKGPPPAPTADTQEQRALDRLDLTGQAATKAQDALDEVQSRARRDLNNGRQVFLKEIKEAVALDQFVQFRDMLDTGPNQGPGRPVTINDLVERVMAFDKNKTGKVSKEDLPERMQHLIAQGDLNNDGYLDREELEKLALKQGQGQGKGPKGKGPKGPKGANVRPFTVTEAERAITKLELTEAPKAKSQKALDEYKDAATKANERRREDLLKQMKAVLTEDQFTRFKDALPAVRTVSLDEAPLSLEAARPD